MKLLRCYVAVAALVFCAVLGTARASQADPITFSFAGKLGDCATPPLGCHNDFSGHTVVGQFTTDGALSTLLAASFTIDASQFSWRILFPDTILPNSTTFTFSPTSLFIHEAILSAISGQTVEDFLIDLNFNSPLTASSGSTLKNGFITEGSQPITSPFVAGAVDVVPEPSSLLFLATGLIGLAYLVASDGTRRRASAERGDVRK